MATRIPLVSVSMVAFNAEEFITDAIEGVLSQKVDFPLELIIGDDCSKDSTRKICETYAEKYPKIIRVLPLEANLGIAGNTARTMGACRGTYIAVCDGDDVWADPMKLKRQVDFLEKNPDFGVVYTDVETISETGEVVEDPEQELIRQMYTSGDVFIRLLQANFINNSTALFRRELISDHIVFPDRSYQIPDHIRWLHVAARSKVHFINYKSTHYRKHTNGLSVEVPKTKIIGNRRIMRLSLYNIIPVFARHNKRPLNRDEQIVLFRRLLSLLFRPPGTLRMRLRILLLLPRYFPGIAGLLKIGQYKIRQLLPGALYKLIFISNLKEVNA